MTQRRSILFVSSNFPPVIGGSTVVYDQICRNAPEDIVAVGSRRNHDTGEPWEGVDAFDASCPYRIHRRSYLRPPATAKRSGTFGRLLSFLLDDLPVMLSTLLFLTLIIVRYRVRVVCLGELISGGWLVFPLRYILWRRVILYTHGEEVSQRYDTMLGRLRPLFLQHANAIVAVSLFCKSQIVSIYGIDARRIFVIPNGVNLEVFCRGEADLTTLPEAVRGHPTVLSVSRLVERKGQEKLIRAFPAVLEKTPDAYCIIVGTGPLAKHLHAVTEELGLEKRVIFLGGVSQDTLVRLYRTCDIFALPCRTLPDGDTEGFGLVFLEANACALPVVAGAAGGTVEAVVDGETGLIVDGNEITQIADALIRLLSDRSFSRRLGEAGWQRAQNWGWAGVAKDFLALCNNQNQIGSLPIDRIRAVPATAIMLKAPEQTKGSPPPRLLVTVDVEEEFVWTKFSRDRHRACGADALAAFHAECRAIGIAPVYLITYPMLQDPIFSRFFDQVLIEGSAEVGIHVHAWTTPPFWEFPNSFNSFQCNLPAHIERRKIEFLCRAYEERFGRAVTIHRAGRWGGSRRTSDFLAEFGISIDLSPSTGYSEPQAGGPDFMDLDGKPFWDGPEHNVLTLPASSVNYLRGPHWISASAFALQNYLPNMRQWGTPVRFSPEGQSTAFLTAMAHQLTLRNLPVAVYTLHSTSLYSGGNPYSATPAMTSALRTRAVQVLKNCVEDQLFVPSTCAELWRTCGGTEKSIKTSTATHK
jgi:glycosyltransferase involved in cell wall biosynthesis